MKHHLTLMALALGLTAWNTQAQEAVDNPEPASAASERQLDKPDQPADTTEARPYRRGGEWPGYGRQRAGQQGPAYRGQGRAQGYGRRAWAERAERPNEDLADRPAAGRRGPGPGRQGWRQGLRDKDRVSPFRAPAWQENGTQPRRNHSCPVCGNVCQGPQGSGPAYGAPRGARRGMGPAGPGFRGGQGWIDDEDGAPRGQRRGRGWGRSSMGAR